MSLGDYDEEADEPRNVNQFIADQQSFLEKKKMKEEMLKEKLRL